MKKSFIGIVVLIALFIILYYVFSIFSPAQSRTASWQLFGTGIATEEGTTTAAVARIAPEDSLAYTNEQYGFSLFYPSELQVREYAEAGGARTISFEDTSGAYGFQIYVTPYGEDTVSPERFRLDVPSGVMKEPTDIVIDGTQATMFWSTNAVMGDVREVWFIYPEPGRGAPSFLYEVTTYADLDQWLSQIMQSWEFI
jgi:hypothetical protein